MVKKTAKVDSKQAEIDELRVVVEKQDEIIVEQQRQLAELKLRAR
jgi:hypothetical protein